MRPSLCRMCDVLSDVTERSCVMELINMVTRVWPTPLLGPHFLIEALFCGASRSYLESFVRQVQQYYISQEWACYMNQSTMSPYISYLAAMRQGQRTLPDMCHIYKTEHGSFDIPTHVHLCGINPRQIKHMFCIVFIT